MGHFSGLTFHSTGTSSIQMSPDSLDSHILVELAKDESEHQAVLGISGILM